MLLLSLPTQLSLLVEVAKCWLNSLYLEILSCSWMLSLFAYLQAEVVVIFLFCHCVLWNNLFDTICSPEHPYLGNGSVVWMPWWRLLVWWTYSCWFTSTEDFSCMLIQDNYFGEDKLWNVHNFLSSFYCFFGCNFFKKVNSHAIFGRLFISTLWLFVLFVPATSYQTINGHLCWNSLFVTVNLLAVSWAILIISNSQAWVFQICFIVQFSSQFLGDCKLKICLTVQIVLVAKEHFLIPVRTGCGSSSELTEGQIFGTTKVFHLIPDQETIFLR